LGSGWLGWEELGVRFHKPNPIPGFPGLAVAGIEGLVVFEDEIRVDAADAEEGGFNGGDE
jgi:hypothetical protein